MRNEKSTVVKAAAMPLLSEHEKLNHGSVDFFDKFLIENLQVNTNLLRGLLIAIFISITALLVRYLLAPFDAGLQYVTFYPAVAIAAFAAGRTAGAVTALLCTGFITYFLFPPHGAIALTFYKDLVWANTFFLINALVIILSFGSMRRMLLKNNALTSVIANSQVRQILENAPNAIVVVNQRDEIEQVNKRVEEYFGYSREELLGQPVEILFPDRFKDKESQYWRQFVELFETSAIGMGRNIYGRRKDGSEIPVEIGINPISTPQGTKMLASFVDMSARKALEGQIHQNEIQLRTMLDSIQDHSIIMLDESGCITNWNLGAERLAGYQQSEVVGKNFSLFMGTDKRSVESANDQLTNARAYGRSEDEGWRFRQDGSKFYASVIINSILDSDNAVIGFVKITRDISERKNHEQTLLDINKRFSNAADAAGLGFWEYKLCNQSLTWDRWMYKLYGRNTEYGAQKVSLWFNNLHPEDMERCQQELQEAIAGIKVFDTTFRVITPSGETRYLKAVAGSVLDHAGVTIEMYGVNFDVTDSVLAAQKQTQLFDELTRINAELNTFTYSASHDLKSPLRGIDQLASWIAEDLGEGINDQTKDYLRLMRSRINRMERLLGDLLAYSRVGRSDDDVVCVSTHELVDDIYDLCVTNKNFTLHIAENMPVMNTYKVPLELVFRNLITNAVKHHDKLLGNIWISANKKAEFIEFLVRDDGPGVSAQHQDRVFGMFQTLRPRDEIEGSGIGLALVRKSIESVGGKITLESDGLTGCTFRFTWPCVVSVKLLKSGPVLHA